MKIAVCGSGFGKDKEILKRAEEIGIEIAKSGNILSTGAGTGYPYAAVKGALKEKGTVICYSPAKNKQEHIKKYSFPFEESLESGIPNSYESSIRKKAQDIFTNKGIPGM